MRKLIRFAALAATISLAACDLAIDNPGSGDTKRVLGTPDDAESLISTYYKRWHTGLYGSTTDLEGMTSVMSLMNYSSLANNCQNSHTPFAGAINGNAPGNVCFGEQLRLYQVEEEVDRVASDFLAKLDAGTLDLSTPPSDPATDYRNVRARAFAEFERGLALGYLALMHDSAAIVSPTMGTAPADCVPDPLTSVCLGALRDYKEVMDSANAALTRSIAYTNLTGLTGASSQGFPIPNTWLPSSTNWDQASFTRLLRSYRARFEANVARTPAERADISAGGIVDWTAVIADAQAGITADHDNIFSTTVGPSNAWRSQYEAFTTWHQMPPFIIGMADGTDGAYAAWIATPLGGRGAGNNGFFMSSPDLRFPQGATRALQQADFPASQCATAATVCKRYFVNRAASGDQFSGSGWGWSNYDFVRYHSWKSKGDAGSARNGVATVYAVAELDLLQAEGQYRLGNYAAAGALVNKTRAHALCGAVACGGGLPAIATFDGCAVSASNATTCGTAVPGGAACVPKIPVAPYNVVACGNLWEALKYEKRIETAYTAYANWYLDERGWGDLPKDTPLYWAVPFQDLQARGRPISAIYGTGLGAGNAPNSTAGASSYGW